MVFMYYTNSAAATSFFLAGILFVDFQGVLLVSRWHILSLGVYVVKKVFECLMDVDLSYGRSLDKLHLRISMRLNKSAGFFFTNLAATRVRFDQIKLVAN